MEAKPLFNCLGGSGISVPIENRRTFLRGQTDFYLVRVVVVKISSGELYRRLYE